MLCDDVTIDQYIFVSMLLTTKIMSIYMCYQFVFTAMMMMMMMMIMMLMIIAIVYREGLSAIDLWPTKHYRELEG
jgi:hypothetical protein